MRFQILDFLFQNLENFLCTTEPVLDFGVEEQTHPTWNSTCRTGGYGHDAQWRAPRTRGA